MLLLPPPPTLFSSTEIGEVAGMSEARTRLKLRIRLRRNQLRDILVEILCMEWVVQHGKID
jgi:hypothetical protein